MSAERRPGASENGKNPKPKPTSDQKAGPDSATGSRFTRKDPARGSSKGSAKNAAKGRPLGSPKSSPKSSPKNPSKSSPLSAARNVSQNLGQKERGRKDPVRRAGTRRSASRRAGLDTPLDSRRVIRGPVVDSEAFGRWSEAFARFMGTAWFLVGMTVFVGAWLAWNAFAPADLQFDPRRLNFTLMTLILSLQASYAAPLILLAQNRQADRDRVTAEQDRDRSERALADTEYLAREVAALRIALGEVATRDFVRSELRALLDELQPKGPEGNLHRKPSRKPIDSFGSTREAELPTDSG